MFVGARTVTVLIVTVLGRDGVESLSDGLPRGKALRLATMQQVFDYRMGAVA